MRVLLVEDEARIANFITRGLSEQGYAVDVASDGDEALYWADVANFDLVILDVMLPGRDGIEVCRSLRRRGVRTPVLMLTARDAVEDRVRGLDSGADAYLVKPFRCGRAGSPPSSTDAPGARRGWQRATGGRSEI